MTCRVRARVWTASPETQVDPIVDVATRVWCIHRRTRSGYPPLLSRDGDRRHSTLGCPVRLRTPRRPASRGGGPVTREGKGERKPRVSRAERPRRRALPVPRSELRGWWGAPLLGTDTSLAGPGVILCRELSLRTEAAVRVSSPGCEVWEPLPPRMVSVRPDRPGLIPGVEGRVSPGSGNHPGGGRGPLGMPVHPGLVVAPEQRPRSRVSAPRP